LLHSTESPVLRSATPHTPKGVVVEQKQCATCSTLAPLVVEQWSRSRNTNGTSRTIGRTDSGPSHSRTYGSLIVGNRPRGLPACAPSDAGRCFPIPAAANAPRAATGAGKGHPRPKNRKYLSNAFSPCAPDARSDSAYSGFSKSRFSCQRKSLWLQRLDVKGVSPTDRSRYVGPSLRHLIADPGRRLPKSPVAAIATAASSPGPGGAGAQFRN
jgi:hypothetical protein